jgi:hypothetical protein
MRITNNNLPSGILAGVKPISFARGGVVYRQAGTQGSVPGVRVMRPGANVLGWYEEESREKIESGLIPVEVPVEIQPGVVRAQTEWREPTTAEESEYHNRLMENLAEQETAERAGSGIAKTGRLGAKILGQAAETVGQGALSGIAQLQRIPAPEDVDWEYPNQLIGDWLGGGLERGWDWITDDLPRGLLARLGQSQREGVLREIQDAGGFIPWIRTISPGDLRERPYLGAIPGVIDSIRGKELGQIPQPPVATATKEQIEAEILTDTRPEGGPEDPYGYGAAAADIDVEAEAARMARSIEKDAAEEVIPDDPERFAGRVGTWFGNLNTRLKEDPEFRRAFIAGAARMGEGAEGPAPVSLGGQFMRGFGEEQTRQAAAKPELVKTIEMLTEMYPGMTPESILKLMSPRSSYGEPNLLLQMRENATDIGKGSVNESLLKTQILGDNFVLVEEGGEEKLDVNTLNRILNSMDRLGIETEFDLVDYLLKKGYIQSTYGVTQKTTGGEGPEESLGQRIKKAFTRTPEQEQMDAYKR